MWSDQKKRVQKIDRLKKTVVVTSDPLALIAEKTNVSRSKEKVVVSSDFEGSEADDFRHFAKDCKKAKVKDYEYYKTKMLLAKKDKDEQVLLAEDQAWMESSSDSDQEINANMVLMAQIEKVLSDSEASSSSVDEKIFENRVEKANQQSKDFENQNKDSQDKYDVLKNQTTTFEMNNKDPHEKNSIEPANVAEALRDADWVSAMQEELDQFARLKVWRLVPRPEGKSVIKTKWIFKNKKDESSLVI
nr:Gag-Pol polyprotein [Tanacetum cinerariifolium]